MSLQTGMVQVSGLDHLLQLRLLNLIWLSPLTTSQSFVYKVFNSVAVGIISSRQVKPDKNLSRKRKQPASYNI